MTDQLRTRITAFLAAAYNPLNLDSTPAKLRQACDLLEEVVAAAAAADAPTPEDKL